MEPPAVPADGSAAHCSCPRVIQLEEQVVQLKNELLRYRSKYGHLEVLETAHHVSEITAPTPQLTFEDNSSKLTSSRIGKHIVLDFVPDSPMFRKNLDGLDESMGGLQGFMKDLLTRTRDFLGTGTQWGEMENHLAAIYSNKYSRTLFTSCYPELGDISTILNEFQEIMTQIQSSRTSMLVSIEALLYTPVDLFCEHELKKASDMRKDVTKFGEEYELLLGKSLGVKQPVALLTSSSSLSLGHIMSTTDESDVNMSDEDAALPPPPVDKVVQARMRFELARFDCVRYLNGLDAKKKIVLLEAFNSTLYSYLNHFHICHCLIKEIEPLLRLRQGNLQRAREQLNAENVMWEAQRTLLQSKIVAPYGPLPVEILSPDTAAARAASPPEKQGYLIVRHSSRAFKNFNWKRVWHQIHAGKLYAIKSNAIEPTLVCDLMVSKVRSLSVNGSAKGPMLPFSFEILDNNQSKQVFQAMNESDLDSWIRAAQASTENMLGRQQMPAQSVNPQVEALVKQLMAANRTCADCGTCPSEWVSINIGAFLCIECSGIHRSLGVHISKVRSLVLDGWDALLLELLLLHLGNTAVNLVWYYHLFLALLS
jgi:Arf-GAP/coiled-coil/ANK repeat/PH domain-containing protein